MFWLLRGLELALIAGFAKVSSFFLNRYCATPHPKSYGAIGKCVQLGAIPIYGWMIHHELSRIAASQAIDSMSWTTTNPFAMVLLVIGSFGFIHLAASTIAFHRYRPPRCQLSCESRIVDFRQDSRYQPWRNVLVGPRPMRRITQLPGNEQLKLEVSTKEFLFSRLPAEWDGLSIVHLADLHFRGGVARPYFEAVCEQAAALKPDLFVFTGDLLDEQKRLEWLPDTLGRLQAPLGQFFILGNHDWYLDPEATRREFERFGWVDVSSRSHVLSIARFASKITIAGDETPWLGRHPELIENPFKILVSHSPDNIAWAREQDIDLMLAGHTHGGQIRLPILGPIYSPSLYGVRYASGVFWKDPTLMYVSRGISGREPIRYGCPPELTKLVLRSEAARQSTEA
ncbi:metallophosphoesterase [Schlesneria paludicola]|uniref:metallophosphoesterase n=1 Tax=Schlesneria paludicola TaxID=360056 RepID=UPI000299DAA3|nr:metallophosphoesterase [Schlesneria paludicola]